MENNNLGDNTDSSLQTGNNQVETLNNWREIWDNYINDCANRMKRRGQKQVPNYENEDVGKPNAQRENNKTTGYKKPRNWRNKKKSVHPDEASSTTLNWTEKQRWRNRKKTTVISPKEKRTMSAIKQNEKHPSQVHAEYNNAKSVSSSGAAESNSESQKKHDSKYKQSKSQQKTLRFNRSNVPENYNKTKRGNSAAASNFVKQKPIYSPLKAQQDELMGVIALSLASNTKDKITTKGKNKNTKFIKGAKKKHFLDINNHSEVIRKTVVNHKAPTTCSNHLWNLYTDFVLNPIVNCTINFQLVNCESALKTTTNLIGNNDACVTTAENFNYLWNLYSDFLHKPTADCGKLAKKIHNTSQLEFVAIDCEMVEIGGTLRRRALARVSIVDQQGEVLIDKFVKPRGVVTDYMTAISGIRPEDIENGEKFKLVRSEVVQILKDKIIVGHGLQHDLKVLSINHPFHARRDTSTYRPLRCYATNGRTPGLKHICKEVLGYKIQESEHCSVEDARAVMKIYNCLSLNWENHIRRHHHCKYTK